LRTTARLSISSRVFQETKTPSKDAKPRRVYKADAAEKWGHDKFLDLEQVGRWAVLPLEKKKK